MAHFDSGQLELIKQVDRPVTIPGNDEALVKVTSHQGYLPGCCKVTANTCERPQNWSDFQPRHEIPAGARRKGRSPSRKACIGLS